MFLRNALFLVVTGVLFFYFLFEARGILFPPKITIDEPRYGDIVHSTEVLVVGYASANTDMRVNGEALRSNDDGMYRASVALFPGYNPIEVRARNRFGYESRIVSTVMLE